MGGGVLCRASADLRNDKEVVLAALMCFVQVVGIWKYALFGEEQCIFELLSKLDIIPMDVAHHAITHGLHWDKGMKEIIENNISVLESRNESTGLLPFMTCACSENCNLDTLFEMMKIKPSVVAIQCDVQRKRGYDMIY